MLAHDFLRSDERKFIPTSSTKSAWYFLVLILAKVARTISIFVLDILLRGSHVISLLWAYKLVSSLCLMPIQKPFSHGKSLRRPLILRILRLSIINSVIEICWLYGLTLCGPVRCILVFELSPSVVMVGIASFIKGNGSPAKTRGILCIIAGLVTLLLMDREETVGSDHSSTHAHHTGLNHLFYHAFSFLGVPDHTGGIVLLIAILFLRIGYDSWFRHLGVEMGGAKRLYSLVNLFSLFILTPMALLISFLFSDQSLVPMDYLPYVTMLLFSAIVLFIIDFYAETVCFQHVADPVMGAARWSPVTMIVSSLFLASLYYPPGENHPLTGAVLFTSGVFSLGCISLTWSSPRRNGAGQLIGMSDQGMPLYAYGEAFLQRKSKSLLLFANETLAEILSNSDSRRIFWFLLVNLSFCGVEFVYGFWTNSLGLISDAFHMLFDCSALVMGLVASVMARWPATKHYSYGFGRVEVLSGFINALFLNVIAVFILMEAWGRIWDPPTVNTDRLLVVAVCGLCVNLFGMYSFHGGEDGHGHSHHGHSHGGGAHGHSHGGANANMQGVFLHVLADTLGSVFVIISTLLMEWFGWQWVDPLCSFILSLLILGSAYPLLRSSASTLLQEIPPEMEEEWDFHLDEILSLDGVISFSSPHVWQLKSDLNVASLHVQVKNDANVQAIRHKVASLLKASGATQSTIQVEMERFESMMRGSHSGWTEGTKRRKGDGITVERRNGGNSHSHDNAHSHNGHGHSH
ncbi:hypothetical protein PENTCL1PPCAC_22913 [Pristionchus entomophagus]|uniref:Proton-coupled zinc antiporter SLC30A5 n=1 Tax=Pristionchus entomophagus TaxID=358040 RepID=A0AAV5U1P9_9BILA|nr:hypothetical protein PENTCL1PPCAC_22913 [Pristionchus entomophagus]